jgi:hypothetical protein
MSGGRLHHQSRTADLLALGGAVLIGTYGVYLLLLGPVVTMLDPDGGAAVSREPNPIGFAFVAAGILVWFGITRHSDGHAWLGAAVATAVSIFFVFGVGGVAIPLAAVLLITLALRVMAAKP